MTPAVLLLTFVVAERVAELWLARRNTTALLAQGAFEDGANHYPLIVALHMSWLGALWTFGASAEVNPYWLSVFALLQVLRIWVLVTLGERWTTRIIVLPGAPLITCGPFRWLTHPNYAVVVLEIAVLPLCLGLPGVALIFSALNCGVLALRIIAEDSALRPRRHDRRRQTTLTRKGRPVPELRLHRPSPRGSSTSAGHRPVDGESPS